MHRSFRPPILRWAAFVIVALLTIAIYYGGLHGPFLLDDQGNLEPVKRWMDGDLDWFGVIDNRSGPLGRPLSMITFMADAALHGGVTSGAFKPTNLLIHIICGATILPLTRRLLAAAEYDARLTETIAMLVTMTWLWLPLQVSTVLYVVQRMAELSTLATLLALLVYSVARDRLERGAPSGKFLLWLAVPGITALGVLAKENAALVFALALVIEYTVYSRRQRPRPAPINIFFLLTVGLPLALAAAYLAIHPDYISGGYTLRSFTLTERVLTEPRILWSYAHTLLFPIGADLGLFHDNYIISKGLLSPSTTALAILGWIAVIGWAWVYRERQPVIACGIGLYLVGHALESTIIPLELYFEHRNYFPSFGAVLAMAGIALSLKPRVENGTAAFRRTIKALAVLVPLSYAAGTLVQAQSWADGETLYAMQESYNPSSARLQSTLAARAIESHHLPSALVHIDLSEKVSPPSEKATATVWRFLAYCETNVPAPPSLYDQLEARSDLPITTFSMLAVDLLAGRLEQGCPSIDSDRIASATALWLKNDHRDPHLQNLWRTRYNLARIMANRNVTIAAANVAEEAWIDSDYNNGIGVFLFQLNATLGDRRQCERILARIKLSQGTGDRNLAEAIRTFSDALDQGKIGTTPTTR